MNDMRMKTSTDIAPDPGSEVADDSLAGDDEPQAVLPKAEWDESGTYEPVIVRGIE
jgi:hypothetical protein